MDQRAILDAIGLRDAVRAGRLSRREIQQRMRATYLEGNWTASQIAAIVNYTPGGARQALRGLTPARRPVTGGTLAVECLDLALQLYGAQTAEHRRNLLDECIRTGTSTRLLAEMTGAPLSTLIRRKAIITKGTP